MHNAPKKIERALLAVGTKGNAASDTDLTRRLAKQGILMTKHATTSAQRASSATSEFAMLCLYTDACMLCHTVPSPPYVPIDPASTIASSSPQSLYSAQLMPAATAFLLLFFHATHRPSAVEPFDVHKQRVEIAFDLFYLSP